MGVPVGAAGGTSGSAGTPPSSGKDTGTSACDPAGKSSMFACLDLDASALIADRARKRLYAVVAGGAFEHANELVVIDPSDATVESSVVVGSDPDALALSEDGTTLWVGLHGAAAIREVDLTRSPPEPGAQYPVPRSSYSPGDAVYADLFLALPGSPDSVLIARRFDHLSAAGDVALVDAGTSRPHTLDPRQGATSLTGGPEGYLFGTDSESNLLVIVADASGLTAMSYDHVVDGALSNVVYDEGYLFTTGGQVIDVSAPEDGPAWKGSFPASGFVIPRVADSRVTMLTWEVDGEAAASPSRAFLALTLHRLELASFKESASVTLDGRYFDPGDFVEPMPGVFAFRDYEIPAYMGAPVDRAAVLIVHAPDWVE